MVALLVLGVVLASGMNQVTRWYHQLSDEMSASSQLLTAQALLMSDLLQLAPRSLKKIKTRLNIHKQ